MAVQAGIQVGSSPISSLIYMKLTNTWMFNFSLNQCCPHSGLVQPLYILAHAVGLTWFWVLIVAPPLGQSEPQCHAEGRSSHILHIVVFKLKKCRHLSFHSTTVVSPPVLQNAILFLLCMSDVPLLGPWRVSPHIFKGGVGGMHNGFYIYLFVCLFLSPSLYPSQQRSVTHPKNQNNTCIILQICHMLSLWSGKSWLSLPVLDWRYAKYVSQCYVDNMWQESSLADADVLMRLLGAVDELRLDAAD